MLIETMMIIITLALDVAYIIDIIDIIFFYSDKSLRFFANLDKLRLSLENIKMIICNSPRVFVNSKLFNLQ
jgi:hypothetical protein